MKIPNKQELNKFYLIFNYSLDKESREFMNLCKKCTAKPYSFLVIDATVTLENPSRFGRNLLERI